MAEDLPHYFKTCRKLAGLTQNQLAHLLGFKNGEAISRLETRAREPNLRIVIYYQLIFNIPPDKLIPGNYKEIRQLLTKNCSREKMKEIRINSRRSGTGSKCACGKQINKYDT